VRTANSGSSVGRGVWVAPWRGPNGETILVAVKRNGCLADWRFVAVGEDHIGASDDLWAMLEDADPEPMLKVI
jgi:hypothetical protein